MPHFIADLKDIWRLAYPYFLRRTPGEIRLWFVGPVHAPENWIGLALLVAVVGLEVASSLFAKMLNSWSQGFGDSIQQRNFEAFLQSLGLYALIVTPYLVVYAYNSYLNQVLQVRWRKSMTDYFVGRWLAPAQHYRIRLVKGPTDNPDQRISDDVHAFVGTTMVLGIGFFGNVLRLVIFLQVLWSLSTIFPMTDFGFTFNIPGYLIWIAIVYAAAGTGITYTIGRKLVKLKYNQERFEANFRFAMARIRENSEQIALLGGEGAERVALGERYGSILSNVYSVIRMNKRLNFFSFFFSQFSAVFPYLLLGPAYFFGGASYGTLMKTLSAFNRVQDGLTWFADSFVNLAEYRAVVQRLTDFETTMRLADEAAAAEPHIVTVSNAGRAFAAEGLIVSLPSGEPITAAQRFSLRPGDRVLLSGRSGSGKTTLLRGFSGIWPFGRGRIEIPARSRALVLPQRPYLPEGTLRQSLVYPRTVESYPDAAVRAALSAVGLGALESEIDVVANWPQRLSGGEQQRLGVARALLARPDWLFLDEATAALDEAGEAALYRTLIEHLPETGIVSIAHRASLDVFHNRRVEMHKGPNGVSEAIDTVPLAAE